MNIIRRKRKELGISQKELSEKLGTSQQTISRIEKADIENIPCSLLVKLANIFEHLRGESQGGAAAGKPVTGTARLQAPDHRAGRHAEGHQQDRERQPSRR